MSWLNDKSSVASLAEHDLSHVERYRTLLLIGLVKSNHLIGSEIAKLSPGAK